MNEDFLARLRDTHKRKRVLEEFDASTLDEVVPLGGEQVRRALSEMHELTDEVAEFVKSLGPSVVVQ